MTSRSSDTSPDFWSYFQELSELLGTRPVNSIEDVEDIMEILRLVIAAHREDTQGPDGYR